MKTTELIKGLFALFARVKGNKKFLTALYALLILGLVFLYTATKARPEREAAATTSLAGEDGATVERRLEEALSCIRGAGRVKVMISYETGVQLVPVMSTDTKNSLSENGDSVNQSTAESTSPASVGGETVVITERQPEVRGVIIVAEGAADPGVRIKLASAAQTVLGVSAEKVEVFEMRSDLEVEQ